MATNGGGDEFPKYTLYVSGCKSTSDANHVKVGDVATSVNSLVETARPQVEQLGPTLQQAQAAMTSLQKVTTQLQEGDGTLGRLMEDPALYEETQRAIATLQRFLADVQANPAKYIGAVNVF